MNLINEINGSGLYAQSAASAGIATNASWANGADVANSATKAVTDGNDNNIVETYATKTEIPDSGCFLVNGATNVLSGERTIFNMDFYNNMTFIASQSGDYGDGYESIVINNYEGRATIAAYGTESADRFVMIDGDGGIAITSPEYSFANYVSITKDDLTINPTPSWTDFTNLKSFTGLYDTVSANSGEWAQGGGTYTASTPNEITVDNDNNSIGLAQTPYEIAAGNNVSFRTADNTVYIDAQGGGGSDTAKCWSLEGSGWTNYQYLTGTNVFKLPENETLAFEDRNGNSFRLADYGTLECSVVNGSRSDVRQLIMFDSIGFYDAGDYGWTGKYSTLTQTDCTIFDPVNNNAVRASLTSVYDTVSANSGSWGGTADFWPLNGSGTIGDNNTTIEMPALYNGGHGLFIHTEGIGSINLNNYWDMWGKKMEISISHENSTKQCRFGNEGFKVIDTSNWQPVVQVNDSDLQIMSTPGDWSNVKSFTGLYNTVSSNSGSWADETLLWSGSISPSDLSITLSESKDNFEELAFVFNPSEGAECSNQIRCQFDSSTTSYCLNGAYFNDNAYCMTNWRVGVDNTSVTNVTAVCFNQNGGQSVTQGDCKLIKVIGVKRK